jgi:formylglycine-generating enzyme required for sulfatase activity
MTRKQQHLLPIGITCLLLLLPGSLAAGSVSISGGSFEPFYPVAGEETVTVEPYLLDTTPVTNAEFLEFTKSNPEWQRSKVPPIFAGSSYLTHWASDADLGSARADAPVTNVSWFAANAFCSAREQRLPTEAEWEFAARADATSSDARQQPGRQQQLLALYAARSSSPGAVGQAGANALGVHDLHGLVWEWTSDFAALLTKGDSRNDGDRDLQLFCGGASLGAADRLDYAAFMRYAFRASLDASSGAGSLGFRCAG